MSMHVIVQYCISWTKTNSVPTLTAIGSRVSTIRQMIDNTASRLISCEQIMFVRFVFDLDLRDNVNCSTRN